MGRVSIPDGAALHVDRDAGFVAVRGWVSIDEGWLEQVACLTGTRDHEVLVATRVRPSDVHAALLMLGANSGQPGRWHRSDGVLVLEPPTGDVIDVFVQVGNTAPVDVRQWIKADDDRAIPTTPFRFGGSALQTRRDVEYYEADRSGSLVGLVTFGDETIGWEDVWSDQQAVHAPPWMAKTEVMPEPGTEVVLILRPVWTSPAR
ncbi:MAG: YdjY domain-containing protein [Phycisphaerales bacterium]|nr:YdjY domain-containing protein [Phycisphaerales bacterium]